MFVLICKRKDAGFGVFFPCYLIMPCMLEKHEVSYGKQGDRCALTSYCALWEKQVSQGVWPSRNCGLEPQKLCSIWQKCCVCPKCVLKGNVLPFFFFSPVKQALYSSPLEFPLVGNITALTFTGLKAGKSFFHSCSYVTSCSAPIADSLVWFGYVTCKHFKKQNK